MIGGAMSHKRRAERLVFLLAVVYWSERYQDAGYPKLRDYHAGVRSEVGEVRRRMGTRPA